MIQKPYSLHNKWCYTVHHTICNLIMCVCILYLHRFCTCAFICRKYGWSEPGSKHNMGTASCAWVESGLCHLFFLYQFSNVLVMILCKLIRKLVATIAYPNRSSVVRPAEWVHRTYKIFVGNGAADMLEAATFTTLQILIGASWASPTLAGLHCGSVLTYVLACLLAAIHRKF